MNHRTVVYYRFGTQNLQPEYGLYKPSKSTVSKLEFFITRKNLLIIKEESDGWETWRRFQNPCIFAYLQPISPRLMHL
jgi:hypothetical protein